MRNARPFLLLVSHLFLYSLSAGAESEKPSLVIPLGPECAPVAPGGKQFFLEAGGDPTLSKNYAKHFVVANVDKPKALLEKIGSAFGGAGECLQMARIRDRG